MRDGRTREQNAFYWVALHEISPQVGYTAETLHDAFKDMFLPPQVPSTGDLSRYEFSEYLNKVADWCRDAEVSFPDSQLETINANLHSHGNARN